MLHQHNIRHVLVGSVAALCWLPNSSASVVIKDTGSDVNTENVAYDQMRRMFAGIVRVMLHLCVAVCLILLASFV